ncbi:hypothetical protein AgCh_017267 [Apium graveolens]
MFYFWLSNKRFYEHGGEMQVAQDAPLRPAMDIFAAGCVIAELFLEGQPLFELSQLLAYRRGQYDPSQHPEKISFHEILKQMMSSKAGEETGTDLIYASNSLDGHSSESEEAKQSLDSRNSRKTELKGSIHSQFELPGDISTLLRDVKQDNHYSGAKSVQEDVISSTSFQKQENCSLPAPDNLLQNISNVFKRNHHPFLKKITLNDMKSLLSDYDNQSDTFGMPFLPLPHDSMSCEAVIVRSAALETLFDILPLIRDFPPSDAKIFPEYILPMLSTLPDDPEESVRICYSSNISKLAPTAYGFLIHSISLSEAGFLNESTIGPKSSTRSSETSGQLHSKSKDTQLARLRKFIAEVIQELVMGPKQTPNNMRALLQDIGNLCWFFGQRQSNDVLLPILPAFLNDRDELLRSVFYGQIIYVCFFVGQRSVEEYLLLYIEQALGDATEAVIVNALDCSTVLCKSGFLRKRILLEMIEHAFPLLCCPSQWVRRSAVAFIAASRDSLGAVDSYVFLVPVIRPFIRRQPASLASEKALLSCLKS